MIIEKPILPEKKKLHHPVSRQKRQCTERRITETLSSCTSLPISGSRQITSFSKASLKNSFPEREFTFMPETDTAQ